MGRLRVLREEPDYPNESHDDGCPGAWYRSPFVDSLHRYERLLTDAGFSDNLLLSRSDDRLLLEALHYYEREKLAARAHNRDQINKTR